MASDLRVDVSVPPLFDGISQIKRKNPGRYLSSADSGVSTTTHGATIQRVMKSGAYEITVIHTYLDEMHAEMKSLWPEMMHAKI